MVIDTGVTGSARPKKSADLTATQPSVPDVPYEPELDIEIDFPRGTRAPRPLPRPWLPAVTPDRGPQPLHVLVTALAFPVVFFTQVEPSAANF